MNSNIACAAVSDMMRFIDSKDLPKVSAYFTHSATVQLLLTALGAVKDATPLRADNYALMSRRTWRSSEISPFAANIAAIKYDCPNDNDRTKVLFFLNQKPMHFSFCNVGLCNWSELKRLYARFDGADCAKTFCQAGGASRKEQMGAVAVVVTVLGLIGQYL